MVLLDANEAVAAVAYRCTETIAIYPITPSSPMAESCDIWSANGRPNLWGDTPQIVQMQSEAGVAGAIHGMLLAGTLSTTFTASQGLLLMIPNMYKIAGELLPFCLHVSARTVATHALSIFGDHSDVMACRQTGFAMLCSNSVQEAQDLACIAHAVTLESRVPVLHFFDGFRTSHEIQTITPLADETLRAMIPERCVRAVRERALTPDYPTIRGTAQNPDVFFQAREAGNVFYDAFPGVLERAMVRFADLTGRRYRAVEYFGCPNADRVVIAMGSGVETLRETVESLCAEGARVGGIGIRLYRPFPVEALAAALPMSCRAIAVLDRTKEPGAVGEPLYTDVVAALAVSRQRGGLALECDPVIIGGRYGLSSKEFTPAMARAVFHELTKERPASPFTVGITDDVTRLSLRVDAAIDGEHESVQRAVFFGLGSDGTVGANKNTIKILGQETDLFAQGYFVYDSKKSGAVTVSHLRFGPEPIRAPWLITSANFVACHQWQLLTRMPVLEVARDGATLLINAPFDRERVWENVPRELRDIIRAKRLRVFVIDAYQIARSSHLGARINTIMQTCFFALSDVLPREQAITLIKRAIRKSYAAKGEELVRRNFDAVDRTLEMLHPLDLPADDPAAPPMPPIVSPDAPDFVRRVTARILAGEGDSLPVSAFPVDGAWPTNTAQWEKRGLAREIPVWDPDICIQCNKCVLVCPHAAIRAKMPTRTALEHIAPSLPSAAIRNNPDHRYVLQVAPDDCTGCSLCVTVCPAKDKSNPRHKALLLDDQSAGVLRNREQFANFLKLPETPRSSFDGKTIKSSQFLQPLFEFSGACAGCGETPYIKLLTQLFGDRLVIANATGCSSIYGGNLPTTPYACDRTGRGPAWANSLFEDNAEFGLGLRMSIDHQTDSARRQLASLAPTLGDEFVHELLANPQRSEADIERQRHLVADLRTRLRDLSSPVARRLAAEADALVRKSVWILGGDGWAYDIGFGGLDHVLSSNFGVNVLVLDTQVYSNTGGQQSKATPVGAVAKFASRGKLSPRKQLGISALQYETAYVASVALGAKDSQTLTALLEAERHPGPSLVIAYSHCIAHGYSLSRGLDQQRLAVDSGFWSLFRYQPHTRELRMDCAPATTSPHAFLQNEARFRMLETQDPARAQTLVECARQACQDSDRMLRRWAGPHGTPTTNAAAAD